MTRAEERTQKEVLTALQSISTGTATASNQDEQTAYLATIDADTGNIDTKLASTNTKLDTVNSNLDSLETKADTGNTNTGSIDTKLTSTNSKLDTVIGHVDGVETKLDTGNTNTGNIDSKLVNDTLTATGSLASSTDNVEINCLGYATVVANIGVGQSFNTPIVTCAFEGSYDGSFWHLIYGTDLVALDGNIPQGTSVTGAFAFPVAGFSKIRINRGIGAGASYDVILRAIKSAQVMNQLQAITFTNLYQIQNTAVSVNTGTADAGTQRVTLASNDAVVTKLEQIRLLLVDIKANQTNGTQVVTTT